MWKLVLNAGHGGIIGMFTSEELAEAAMLEEMMEQLAAERHAREVEEELLAEREYRDVREFTDAELLDGMLSSYEVEYEVEYEQVERERLAWNAAAIRLTTHPY